MSVLLSTCLIRNFCANTEIISIDIKNYDEFLSYNIKNYFIILFLFITY